MHGITLIHLQHSFENLSKIKRTGFSVMLVFADLENEKLQLYNAHFEKSKIYLQIFFSSISSHKQDLGLSAVKQNSVHPNPYSAGSTNFVELFHVFGTPYSSHIHNCFTLYCDSLSFNRLTFLLVLGGVAVICL